MPKVKLDPTGKGLIQETGGSVHIMGVQNVTATDDGTGAGQISATGGPLVVVDADSDANHIVTLPQPQLGMLFIVHVAATGCELRSSSPTTIGINGVTGAGKELALAVNSSVICVATSLTNWAVTPGTAATAD